MKTDPAFRPGSHVKGSGGTTPRWATKHRPPSFEEKKRKRQAVRAARRKNR